MIIDTHCHLDNIKYIDDVDVVIDEALRDGVNRFIIPGADPKDLPKAVELSNKYDEVFFAVGIHPYDIDNYDEKLLEKFITHPKCIAVGECGLDFYRLPEDEDKKEKNISLQIEIFKKQINLAKKYNKPLIIHIREASQMAKEILLESEAYKVGGVLHCFNASEMLLDLSDSFYYGIGGVITFKNGKKLKQILHKIPLDRLLIETDAPYLTPEPFRGTRNEPKYTTFVVKKISELLDRSVQEIEDITTQNANRLFKGLL